MASTNPQAITLEGKLHRQVREGRATVLAPYRDEPHAKTKKGHNNDEGDQSVFYNPIQQFNRDLSVLAILTYGEGVILEKEAKIANRKLGRRKGGKRKADACNDAGPAAENPRKRNADDVEEGGANNGAKKARVDEFEAEEEELEVKQLSRKDDGNVIDTPVAQINGKDTNGHAKESKVPFSILDALSASGIRALRYAKEIPFATTIIANDISREAVQSIELNIEHNDVGNVVHSNVGDARAYMSSKIGNERPQASSGYVHRFDVIDLDPYGTAATFFDAALQSIQDGGLLCVTCTDAGVFASNGYPEKAFALYGGLPLKGAHSHEGGLRLILNSVATSAARYGFAIEPLLSLSIDFYARCFIRVHRSPQSVKLLAGTTMLVYSCDNGCGSWVTQALTRNQERQDRSGAKFFKHSIAQGPTTSQFCEHCKRKMHLGGPMWAGTLHNPYFIQRILDRLESLDTTIYGTLERVRGMLTVALEEDLTLSATNTSTEQTTATAGSATDAKIIPRLPPQLIDATPLFFIPNFLAKILHCSVPSEDQFRGAIRNLGYRVTRSHCKAGSMKTNAPWNVIWEVMREWVGQKAPIKEGSLSKGQPGWEIMRKARGTEAARVEGVKKRVMDGLEKAEGLEDVKTALRAAMWTLEHEKIPVEDEADAAPRTNSASIDAESPDIEVDGPATPPPPPPQAASTSKLKVVFDERLGKERPRGKLIRYQINPRANWGPMNRAGGAS